MGRGVARATSAGARGRGPVAAFNLTLCVYYIVLMITSHRYYGRFYEEVYAAHVAKLAEKLSPPASPPAPRSRSGRRAASPVRP